MDPRSLQLDALVVLGSKVDAGQPSSALLRRLQHARVVYGQRPVPVVVMSGGKIWQSHSEAEVMARWWRETEESVAAPDAATPELVLETRSQTTRTNAHYVATLLRSRRIARIGLVTCDFHMARAARLFARQGFVVFPLAACAQRPWRTRLRLWLRERAATTLGAFERIT